MFYNAGGRIKILAKVIFVLSILLSILAWVFLMCRGLESESIFLFIVSFLVLLVGISLSWLNSIFIYAFGSFVENTAYIANNTRRDDQEDFYDPYY